MLECKYLLLNKNSKVELSIGSFYKLTWNGFKKSFFLCIFAVYGMLTKQMTILYFLFFRHSASIKWLLCEA